MVQEQRKFENIPEDTFTLSIDIDVNLEALKKEGITEQEIDKLFEINNDKNNYSFNESSDEKLTKKQKQTKLDKELTKKFIENPTHEVFSKIWERYYFGIRAFANKFLKDWELADDMVSQTFTRAWEHRETYNPEKAKLSTWLYIICKNLCLGEINTRKKDNLIPNDISNMYDSTLLKSGINTLTESTQYIMSNNGIEKQTLDDLTYKLYDTSIDELEKLGPIYSDILKMKLLQDLKIREIAVILNMNESTVKNYLYKGKQLLKDVIKKNHKKLYELYIDSANTESQKIY